MSSLIESRCGLMLAGLAFAGLFAAAPLSVADDLMSPYDAAQFGLVESFRHQLDVGLGADSIVDQRLHVSGKDTRQYVELVRSTDEPAAGQDPAAASSETAGAEGQMDTAEVVARFATKLIGRDGRLVDLKEATRLAKNEQRRMKRRGIETDLRTVEASTVRIYTLSDRGNLESIDGETGQTIWRTRVGDPLRHYAEIGVTDKYVACVNGATLFVLSADSGKVIKERALTHPAGFGPSIAGELIMVPGIGGTIEGVFVTDTGYPDFNLSADGAATAPLSVSPDAERLAVPSETGYVFVMHADGRPAADFRLGVAGEVIARIATASGHRFFFATTSGQVYALEATREGRVLWTIPLGEPVFSPILMDGDRMFVRTSFGNLFALDIANGVNLWGDSQGGILSIIGATSGNVLARTMSGGVVVLDASTGELRQVLRSLRPARVLTNAKTDRLYLISQGGTLQCLRPVDSALPTLKQPPPIPESTEVAADEEDELEVAETDAGVMDDVDDNPFGAGMSDDNPFGADSDNPFGTGDDDGSGGLFGDAPF